MKPRNLALALFVIGLLAVFLMVMSSSPTVQKVSADHVSSPSSFAQRWQRMTESNDELSPALRAELRQIVREELQRLHTPSGTVPPADSTPGTPATPITPQDQHHGHAHQHDHKHDEPTQTAVTSVPAKPAEPVATKPDEHVHDAEEFPQLPRCTELKTQFSINPGKDWGTAPEGARQEWRQLFCDDIYADTMHHDGSKVPGNDKLKDGIRRKFGGRANAWETYNKDLDLSKKPKDTKVITFLTPMTTSHSKHKIDSPDKLIFWQLLFPSFLSMSNDLLLGKEDKYWYTFYIGYDDGDPLLSLPTTHEAIWKGMQDRLKQANMPLHKVGLRILCMNDTVHAPSWAVSHLAQAAFDRGTDYFYQINDDVQMQSTGWEDGLTSVLFSSQNVGVTGPQDRSNAGILTQSFAHRTHLEIFGTYFAEPFKNWWSDDWLTAVYGPYTHRRHEVYVRHEHEAEGQRYPVHEAKGRLDSEVEKGKQRIRDYIAKHNLKGLSL